MKSIDSAGRKTWYYVELRRPIGFDSFVSNNNNVMNGVVLHTATEGYTASTGANGNGDVQLSV